LTRLTWQRIASTVRRGARQARRAAPASHGSQGIKPVQVDESGVAPEATPRHFGGVVFPPQPKAARSLGLCDTERILSNTERVALDRDVADLLQVRREAEARSTSIRLR